MPVSAIANASRAVLFVIHADSSQLTSGVAGEASVPFSPSTDTHISRFSTCDTHLMTYFWPDRVIVRIQVFITDMSVFKGLSSRAAFIPC